MKGFIKRDINKNYRSVTRSLMFISAVTKLSTVETTMECFSKTLLDQVKIYISFYPDRNITRNKREINLFCSKK